jgi:radical SAM superfamily enzyme YgiQ (UPF0313 family)
VRRAVKYAVGLGIEVICSLILGHPDETEEDAQMTLDFMEELRQMGVGEAGFAFLTPFPGADVYEHRETYGITLHETDWAKYTGNSPIISTRYLSRDQLRALYIDASIQTMRHAQTLSRSGEVKQ